MGRHHNVERVSSIEFDLGKIASAAVFRRDKGTLPPGNVF